MIYRSYEAKKVLETGAATGKLLANTGTMEFVHLTIEAEGEVPSHSLPIKVTFFVVSGNGTISVDGQEHNLNTNDIIEVAPDTQRSWINKGTDKLVLFVIKHNKVTC